MVDAGSGRVLLHHHRRLGRWLQLGGHDEGEHDPLATALREAREESGLLDLRPLSTAILDIDVHDIPARRSEPAHLHHDVRYALQTSTPDAIAQQEAESLDLAWLDLDGGRPPHGRAGRRPQPCVAWRRCCASTSRWPFCAWHRIGHNVTVTARREGLERVARVSGAGSLASRAPVNARSSRDAGRVAQRCQRCGRSGARHRKRPRTC